MIKKSTFIAIFGTLIFALATISVFAGTYSITTTANQDSRLERQRIRLNKQTCQSAGLPVDCTQAQIRNTYPTADIYSDVGDLIDRHIVKNYLEGLKTVDSSDDAAQAKALWDLKTDAQKNAVCATIGLPNGCEIWPR